jgi:uncharacterized membrane protein
VQSVALAVSGAALAFFGCVGALAQMNFNTGALGPFGVVGAVVFVIGALVFLVGGLLIVFYVIRAIARSLSPTQPDDAGPPDGTVVQ